MLVTFILASYGLTQILVYSKILEPIRPKAYLFNCPMCMGFWSGVFLVLLNPFTELFTYDYNFINALLLGGLSAGTSYFLSMVLNDFGLKFRNTVGGDEK